MWQVAKEGPAFDAGIEQAPVVVPVAVRVARKRVERAVAARAVAKSAAPRGFAVATAPGVRFVEAAVVVAVVVYFVAGVIGVFVN